MTATAATADFRIPPPPESRLPGVGTTIFTVMSALAQEQGAVNLGQGFPDFGCDPALVDAVADAMRAGHNQYPPMTGLPALRQAVAQVMQTTQGVAYDADREITITAGATQGLFTAIQALVRPGDEVVVLEPAYDSYLPALELAGATVHRVPLTPMTFRPDFDRIAAALSPRTRLVLVNTPHNPSGTVWSRADWQMLADLLAPTDAWLLSDEVYEHMVFDGQRHVSAAALPALRARAVVVTSFGKTLHVTGWKVGAVLAPPELMAEFRKVHQFNVFTVNTPMQHGLAAHLAQPQHYLGLADFYQAKRDHFRAGLAATRLRLLPCEGTYFQCVDYSAVSSLGEMDFCRWLCTELGVAAIPLSAFYRDGTEQGVVRFCFAKQTTTLDAALQRLARL
ncbi:pyridoxal phosphate-dependent aminotransferase [Amphibiibacter pelophylacis]|uniref:Pyridoxal phosphate-dependent aminotransferase n=1 Tax=Amphibiibacter pelophylacis TaxID=1799477 RepID=A0ACC6P4G8_9BURK